MNKYNITLEEIISQQFTVDIYNEDNIYDEIRSKYLDRQLVLENPSLTELNVMIEDADGESDWVNLHCTTFNNTFPIQYDRLKYILKNILKNQYEIDEYDILKDDLITSGICTEEEALLILQWIGE